MIIIQLITLHIKLSHYFHSLNDESHLVWNIVAGVYHLPVTRNIFVSLEILKLLSNTL